MRNYLSTSLADNVFDAMPLFAWLRGKDRYKSADGGDTLVEPLLYGKNSTVSSFSGLDTIDTQPQDGVTAATYNWKGVAGSVVISEYEKLMNSGKHRIINLLETKTEQLMMSLKDELNIEAFGDGTGNGGKDLTGLQAMIGATGILGGIDSSTYSWWRSEVETNAEALTMDDLIHVYNGAGGQVGNPDLVLTTQTLFESYEKQAFGKLDLNRGANDSKNPIADLGFETLRFKGATMAWDEQCPTGNVFMPNSKFLKLRYHPDADFKATEKKQPSNQLAWVWQVYWFGNLTTNNRRRHGRLSGKTAFA